MKTWIYALCCAIALFAIPQARAAEGGMLPSTATLLVEAESLADYGGWSLDTQFIPIMGSSYLLAHGLGEPVKDATGTITLPGPGNYRVFVRTKDWVARWNAPGQPGRFQLLVDGKPLAATFGTEGAEWHWQDGGTVSIGSGPISVALHDLTGFDGRCDAICFSRDPSFVPPEEPKTLASWRRKAIGLPDKPADAGPFDLVVVGGGYAGMASAIAAARMGCNVALIQDRPVLGGNGSSEVRVASQGGTTMGKYPLIGQIVEEFADNGSEGGPAGAFGDPRKEAIVRAEKNISLYLNTQAFAAEATDGRIISVTGRDTRSGAETRFTGKLFVDCTGHGTIGFLAGAKFDELEKGHMGMSNMWRWTETSGPQAFPQTPWALPLDLKDFPYPTHGRAPWFWESGFYRDPINDLEMIRDWNLRAVFGAFNAMKNGDGKEKHLNARLEWVAYIGGNRESRRLIGDVVLTREDINGHREFPDGCVPSTWDIDLHTPKEQYAKKFPDDPFISKAIFDANVDKKNGYPIPYRCFYSQNVANLFMAGRDISVTHEALGTVRVMRTCGMEGEVVGKAASICAKYDCTPRDLWQSHFDDLIALMKLPGQARRQSVKDAPDAAAPLPYDPAIVGKPATPRRPGAQTPVNVATVAPSAIVIDDDQAVLSGTWVRSSVDQGFIGAGYRYARPDPAQPCSARFDFKAPAGGRYDVRFTYRPAPNRATNAGVTVISADGEKGLTINEHEADGMKDGFTSLGAFRFEAGAAGAVVVTNKNADGLVVIDAVEFVQMK
jgi:hypothetical protein